MNAGRFVGIVTLILIAWSLGGCGNGASAPPKTQTADATVSGSHVASVAAADSGTSPALSVAPGVTATTRPDPPQTPSTAVALPSSVATPSSGPATVSADVTAATSRTEDPSQPSNFESTVAAELEDPSVAADLPSGSSALMGGSPGDSQRIVATVASGTPDAGRTPTVDPAVIAPPQVAGTDLAVYVDADAGTPGIQATRSVHVGDIVRVAVVIGNVPADEGIGALNFHLNYDKTKITAPTIVGGASTNRNPALNVAGLGGAAVNWSCLPAPEGDLDDPGGLAGDGDPSTGEAFLSCFTPGTGHATGTLVLAVITFEATAKGSTGLTLSEVAIGNDQFNVASCDATLDPLVPCTGATLIVE